MLTEKQSLNNLRRGIEAIGTAAQNLNERIHSALVAGHLHAHHYGDVRPVADVVEAAVAVLNPNGRKQLAKLMKEHSPIEIKLTSKKRRAMWKDAETVEALHLDAFYDCPITGKQRRDGNVDWIAANPFFEIELDAPENSARLFDAEMLVKRLDSLVKDIAKAGDPENERFGFRDAQGERLAEMVSDVATKLAAKVRKENASA